MLYFSLWPRVRVIPILIDKHSLGRFQIHINFCKTALPSRPRAPQTSKFAQKATDCGLQAIIFDPLFKFTVTVRVRGAHQA